MTDWVKYVRKKIKKISGGEVKEEISAKELQNSLNKALTIAKEENEKDKIELVKAKKKDTNTTIKQKNGKS